MERKLEWICKATEGTLVGDPTDRHLVVLGVSTDTRTLTANQLFVPLVGERFDGHAFYQQAAERGAAASLWQEDHPLPEKRPVPLIVVKDCLAALQKMAQTYRLEWNRPIVAVTGSNGKTTTKELLASVLGSRFQVHKTQGNLNNHIGVPLTLLSIPATAEAAVIEMGMSNRGEISFLSRLTRPNYAVITNIGESHIQFLGSRAGIAEAKLEILDGLSQDGILVYDGDEPLLNERLTGEKRTLIPVGIGEHNVDRPLDIQMNGTNGYTFVSAQTQTRFALPILGKHNVKNALLAIQIGRAFGLTEEEIQRGLANVQGVGKRLERVTARNGMQILDDSYNASPTSVKAALNLLSELEPQKEKWALLGDIRELGEEWEEKLHREVGRYAIESGIHRLYTIGERGRWIAEGAKEVNSTSDRVIHHLSSQEEAIELLHREGNPKALLLVKASRAMQLDQVVKRLVEGE